MPNAIGETTLTTFVRDVLRMVVKIIPSNDMNRTTPAVISNPNTMKMLFLLSFETLFAKYAKNPGNKGRTHTAPNGVSNPNVKEERKSASILLQSPELKYLHL